MHKWCKWLYSEWRPEVCGVVCLLALHETVEMQYIFFLLELRHNRKRSPHQHIQEWRGNGFVSFVVVTAFQPVSSGRWKQSCLCWVLKLVLDAKWYLNWQTPSSPICKIANKLLGVFFCVLYWMFETSLQIISPIMFLKLRISLVRFSPNRYFVQDISATENCKSRWKINLSVRG